MIPNVVETPHIMTMMTMMKFPNRMLLRLSMIAVGVAWIDRFCLDYDSILPMGLKMVRNKARSNWTLFCELPSGGRIEEITIRQIQSDCLIDCNVGVEESSSSGLSSFRFVLIRRCLCWNDFDTAALGSEAVVVVACGFYGTRYCP